MHRVAIAAMIVLTASTACTRVRTPLAVHEVHTFPAAPDKLVRLDVGSLDVHLKVADVPAITVTLDIDARSSSHGAATRWIANHTPVFEDSASELSVRLPSRHSAFFLIGYLDGRARLDLEVPPSCRLELRTSSGDVDLEGSAPAAGTTRVTTSSGDVGVAGGARELVVRTSSGDVRVTRQPLAAFEADTSSGNVTLESGAARALVETSSGDIRLEELAGGLSATASSGDVSASWSRIAGGTSVRVNASSGDVRLRIPSGTALAGEVASSSGSVRSDFEGTRSRHDHRIDFGAAASAVTLDVRTTSGDVTVHAH